MKISFVFFAVALAAGVARAAIVNPNSSISNVQNYSSNPFWSINGPYNQQVIPTPVYVGGGPQIGAGECQAAVDSAIWTQCGYRANCNGVRSDDIRAGVMSELAGMSTNNYTTCAAYIDARFAAYKQQFPDLNYRPYAAAPAPAPQRELFAASDFQSYNDWQKDNRGYDLERMQYQSAGGAPTITPSAMPGTFEDLSFVERVNAQREGWQDPHVNVYATYGQGVNVEKDSTMYERQKKELELQEGREVARNKLLKATNLDQYCDDVRNLTDETCKKYWQTKEPDGRFKQWYPTDWEKFDKERLRGNTAVLCAAYPKESECCPYFKANNQANYQLYCSAQYIAGRCDELAKTGLQNLCVAGGCPNDSRCCPWYENQKDAASLASYCPGFSPGKTDPDAELDPSSGRRIKIPLKL